MVAELYFRHSGRFSPRGLVAMFAAGAAAALLLGSVYGIADFYTPLLYRCLLTIGLGLALGVILLRAATLMHVRNVAAVALAGVFCGVVADYAAFVTWLLAQSQWRHLFLAPGALAAILPAVNQQGLWGWGVWLAEWAIITGLAVSIPRRGLLERAYCEACGAWVTDKTTVQPLEPIADAAAFRGKLEEGDFALLGALRPLPAEAPACSMMELSRCSSCNNLHLLTVKTVNLEADDKGRVQKQATTAVQHLLIDAESRELILKLASTQAEPQQQV